jgi:phage terminase large subunit-like protein
MASLPTHSPETESAKDFAAIALAYAKRAAADHKGKLVCKWVRLAAERHLRDLRRKDWPFQFDAWHANDVCDFIEKLPHVEGQWETPTLTLEPAQIFILAVVFGWRRKDNGRRRFTMAYVEMARKGAKSTLTAGVSLYCTCCEDEPGPLTLIGATTGDQARKVFNPARLMVKKLPELQQAFDLEAWARTITCGANGGTIQTINAKSSTQDGHNPHLAVLDELHAHQDRGLFDVIRSAFGARRNPLLWMITTAGFNMHGVCYEQRSFVTKVLEQSVSAEHFFGIIFTLDEDDDPFDERNWVKANPLMPVTPTLDEMRSYAIEAKASPGAEGEFKTKRLNIWMGAASAWLNVSSWRACGGDVPLKAFKGLDCYIGADLSDKDDITGLVLAARDATGRLLLKTWFWLPEAALERASQTERENVMLYRQWRDERKLWITPGDWIDHNKVERLIRRLKASLNVRRVTFDQFAAAQGMAVRLNEDLADGDEPFAVVLPKNARNVTDPAKDLEARHKVGPDMLLHDSNPVMTWMAGNVVVSRRVDGSILPKKPDTDSKAKIDGIDAAVNAIAPMMDSTPSEGPSVYEDRGILVF